MPSPNHLSCSTHCCLQHGCKYGFADCPVVTEQEKQTGPCWECLSVEEARGVVENAVAELEWSLKIRGER